VDEPNSVNYALPYLAGDGGDHTSLSDAIPLSLLLRPPGQATLVSGQPEIVPYKVARKYRLLTKGDRRLVAISVAPGPFGRDEMTRLARKLNQDFSEEPRLLVEIMDDQEIAEHVPPAGEYYHWYMSAKRGEYHLDREKGLEYVQFSTKRGRPGTEVTLNFGRTPPKRLKNKRRSVQSNAPSNSVRRSGMLLES